jgi:hypothetical protein
MELKHRIRLIMGDPGGDGHGRYSERICASNLSGKELKEAYTTGTKLLGFDFTANICSDYGEQGTTRAYNLYKIQRKNEAPEVWSEAWVPYLKSQGIEVSDQS